MIKDNNNKDKENTDFKTILDMNSEEIHKGVFELLYPKNEPNNINTLTKDNSDLKFVPLDYFNAKILLLMQEIEFILKEITDIKAYYKNISNKLDYSINNIINLIVKYAADYNLDVKAGVDDVKIEKKNIKNTEFYDKNLKKKKKKHKKVKNLINIEDNKFLNEDKKNPIIPKDSVDDVFPDIDLDSIDFDLGENKSISGNKIDIDSKSDSSESNVENLDTLNKESFNKIINTQSIKQRQCYFLKLSKKDKIYDLYTNLKGSSLLDDYRGIEESAGNGIFNYYAYVHFVRKKRLTIKDIEDSTFIDYNFNKIKNLDSFLETKGKIIFNPFKK
jgi:hypothetical protein